MHSMLADAVDFSLVFVYGIAVLVPLLLFQVGIEAWVLRYIWHIPFREMARFAFRANCWSLAAGIPTKILNGFLDGIMLPRDIPGFFARYPFAVALGTLIYFAVTILVERAYATRWCKINESPLAQRSLWIGILAANLATYAILAPLHYFATRPRNDVREFTQDVRWSSHLNTQVLFTDSDNGHLKSVRLGELTAETIVPTSVKDYLVSSNASVCLYRGEGGSLVLYQRSSGLSNLVWQTNERFSMNQVAFSPSAERVAFASERDCFVEVVDLKTGKRVRQPLRAGARGFNVAWSPDDGRFYISDNAGNRFAANITPEFSVTLDILAGTNEPPLLTCYGRVGPSRWWGGGDWGHTYENDSCDQLRAWSVPGLGSSLRIYREGTQKPLFTMAVNPGLLHLSAIHFGDVAFLAGCKECLCEAGGGIYLIDLEQLRLGTVALGKRFILFTPRYQKHL